MYGLLEKMAFGTSGVCSLLQYRVRGALVEAFDFKAGSHAVPAIEPMRFLASPGLWSGLVVAVVFIAVAVRLRRHREPI